LRLLVASKIDGHALAQLEHAHDAVVSVSPPPDVLRELIVDREVVIFRSGVELPREILDLAPDLKLLVRAGSGLDNIDPTYLASRGIDVVRIPGPGAQSVAELSFTFMLALARRIFEADASMREGRWLKSQLEGRTLSGKVLGVVGLGNIGTRVARMGTAWGMAVIGCVERPSPQRREEFASQSIELTSLDDVLERADFVSIHVPRNTMTIGLIGADELRRMRPGAFLVNVARGGVVVEAALLEALRDGRLAGAGVDVHVQEGDGARSPLADLPNVVLTPHIGATTTDAQAAIGREIVEIIARTPVDQAPLPAPVTSPIGAPVVQR